MKPNFSNLRRFHFEARMFISMNIVLVVCLLFAGADTTSDPLFAAVGWITGLAHSQVVTLAYLTAALAMLIGTILRMWAGSQLNSDRVMSFPVQADRLITSGPYRIVRNPIYLADLIAISGAGIPLGLPGLLLPILFILHYSVLIRYEERFLREKHSEAFADFVRRVPRLFPSWRSLRGVAPPMRKFSFNHDGIRHNATFVMYIFGFFIAAWTHVFWHAAIIGLPTVIDWAYIHTKKGTSASRHTLKLNQIEGRHA